MREEHLAVLAGATVVLVADRDDTGRSYVATAAAQLQAVGCSVTVVEPAEGKDAFDHLEAGLAVSDFVPVDLADLGGGEDDSSGGGGPGSSANLGAGGGVLGDGHRGTDVGNAERLVAASGGLIRYVRAWGCWIVYDEGAGAWRLDLGDVLVTEMAKAVARRMFKVAAGLYPHERDPLLKWAKRSESAKALADMVKVARGMEGLLVDHRELDRHPWLLNVANGTVDLRTGELLPHDPGHLLTKQAPVLFDPDAAAPLWESCCERGMRFSD